MNGNAAFFYRTDNLLDMRKYIHVYAIDYYMSLLSPITVFWTEKQVFLSI